MTMTIRLDRSKMIDGYISSQALAGKAIALRQDADLVHEAASGLAGVPPRTASTAVRVLLTLADAIEAEARAICIESKIELPPDVEAKLSEGKAKTAKTRKS